MGMCVHGFTLMCTYTEVWWPVPGILVLGSQGEEDPRGSWPASLDKLLNFRPLSSLECQPDVISSHLGDRPPGMSVRSFQAELMK